MLFESIAILRSVESSKVKEMPITSDQFRFTWAGTGNSIKSIGLPIKDKQILLGYIFDKVIEWLLVVMLIFMPLAFGAVDAWSEQIVILISGAILICFLMKLALRPEIVFLWSWAYLPAGLFVLLVVFQLLPLNVSFVEAVSPRTAAVKTELLGDLPDADELLSSMTVSFYPNVTIREFRLVLSVAALFVVVLNVYRHPAKIKRLLASIAVIGGIIAVIALVQNLFGNDKINWVVPCHDDTFFGPFINHSHYSQFMNLSVGACVALLMVMLHEFFAGRKTKISDLFEYFGSTAGKSVLVLVFIIIIGIVTIFISLSRGGMISTLIAGGITTLVLFSRKSLRIYSWIMVVIVLGAFICILYVDFDAVYGRLATLKDFHHAQGSRPQILKDIANIWTEFPIFGTGFGTHEVVYPMFEHSTIALPAAHAENEYAQVAEETGLAGLILLVMFAIIIWSAYVKNIRFRDLSVKSAAYGLGFGLLAIMIHSLSDFGQHLPANASLSAIYCALLLGIAGIKVEDKRIDRIVKSTHMLQLVRIGILLGVVAVWSLFLFGANNERVAEKYWRKALVAESVLSRKNWQGTNGEYIDLISNSASAVNYHPHNVKYRYWLNIYRWRSISRMTEPATDNILMPVQAINFVRQIVGELHKTRLICPTFGPAYCVVGQLEKHVLSNPAGATMIKKGYSLAPCDAAVCFAAGLLDTQEARPGWIDESLKKFKRAVQLDERMFNHVADVYINQLKRPHLAITIAGDNIDWLIYVVNTLSDFEEFNELQQSTRFQITELLKSRCEEKDVSAGVLAHLAAAYRSAEAYDNAIDCYRRAIALDYARADWHFDLARLLAKTKRIPEAIHEAKICLRLNPEFRAPMELIADLSVQPSVISEQDGYSKKTGVARGDSLEFEK
jgi:O-antigen ligase/tetratricopeptide (TPR) repeat protein